MSISGHLNNIVTICVMLLQRSQIISALHSCFLCFLLLLLVFFFLISDIFISRFRITLNVNGVLGSSLLGVLSY